MARDAPFDRDQPFLLPPDVKDGLPEDELAHFVVAAAERVRLGAFCPNRQAGGQPQYHPRLMLALLVCGCANGVFASRRLERATYRDIGAPFIAADTHPDPDTIATFRRTSKTAFEAAFLETLLLARASGLSKLGTVPIEGPSATPTLRKSVWCAEPVLGPAADRTGGTAPGRWVRS